MSWPILFSFFPRKTCPQKYWQHLSLKSHVHSFFCHGDLLTKCHVHRWSRFHFNGSVQIYTLMWPFFYVEVSTIIPLYCTCTGFTSLIVLLAAVSDVSKYHLQDMRARSYMILVVRYLLYDACTCTSPSTPLYSTLYLYKYCSVQHRYSTSTSTCYPTSTLRKHDCRTFEVLYYCTVIVLVQVAQYSTTNISTCRCRTVSKKAYTSSFRKIWVLCSVLSPKGLYYKYDLFCYKTMHPTILFETGTVLASF